MIFIYFNVSIIIVWKGRYIIFAWVGVHGFLYMFMSSEPLDAGSLCMGNMFIVHIRYNYTFRRFTSSRTVHIVEVRIISYSLGVVTILLFKGDVVDAPLISSASFFFSSINLKSPAFRESLSAGSAEPLPAHRI